MDISRWRFEQNALTQSLLKSILHYDEKTGHFTWLVRMSNKHAGSSAGKTDTRGYRRIKINGRSFRAHRLAWLYVFGEPPKGPIDHIDGNAANNSISNLRLGGAGINQQNVRRPQRNNKSGFLGVHKRTDSNTYRVCISVNGKMNYLGGYKTAEDAHAAYLNAKRQLHAGCTI